LYYIFAKLGDNKKLIKNEEDQPLTEDIIQYEKA